MSGKDRETPRQRLARVMKSRAEELRLPWNQVATRAGMEPQNLLRIRKGQINISWRAADGIERALRWEPGSVEAILEGREATPADEPVPIYRPEVDSVTGEVVTTIGHPVWSDEWIEHYADYPELVKKALIIRRMKRDIDEHVRMLAEQAADVAERTLPEGSGSASQ